jgi:hypothetical protein
MVLNPTSSSSLNQSSTFSGATCNFTLSVGADLTSYARAKAEWTPNNESKMARQTVVVVRAPRFFKIELMLLGQPILNVFNVRQHASKRSPQVGD